MYHTRLRKRQKLKEKANFEVGKNEVEKNEGTQDEATKTDIEGEPEFEDYDLKSHYYDLTRVPVGVDLLIAKVNSQSVVLDAGCGTGNYLCAIAPHVREIVPFEFNQGMLNRCMIKAIRQELYLPLTKNSVNPKFGPIRKFMKGSLLEKLPFDDGTFDLVMNNQVIHHLDTGTDPRFPNILKVLGEFYRVLKPGGWLAINYTTPEQSDSFWWQYLIPRVKGEYRNKYIPTKLLWKYMSQLGFKNLTGVPVIEPLQGNHYFNIAGPLSQYWRNGDSTWSLVTDTELNEAKAKVQSMIDDGSIGFYFDACDEKRRLLGQSTFVFAQK